MRKNPINPLVCIADHVVNSKWILVSIADCYGSQELTLICQVDIRLDHRVDIDVEDSDLRTYSSQGPG